MKIKPLALSLLFSILLPCQAFAETQNIINNGTLTTPSTAGAPVTASVPLSTSVPETPTTPDYTITIPVNIEIGRDLTASYTVNVQGTVASDRIIKVKPDKSVTMTSESGTETIDVYQPKTRWTCIDIAAEGGTSTKGSIKADRLTEGDWKGTLNFTIDLQEVAFVPYDDKGVAVTWDELIDLKYVGVDINSYNGSKYCYADFKTTFTNNLPKGTLIIPESAGLGVVGYTGSSSSDRNFEDCTGLTSVVIPEGVSKLGYYAFKDCKNLKSVMLPSTLTSMYSDAFSGCTSLTDIVLPNGLTHINDNSFYSCTSLPSINIPNTVTSIGRCAFYNCKSLTSIDIPNSVTNIADYAFSGCTKITSIEVPDSVTTIGSNAFEGIDIVYYSGTASGGYPWGAKQVIRNYK